MPWLTVKALKYEVDSLFRLHWQWTFFSVLQVSIAATVRKPQIQTSMSVYILSFIATAHKPFYLEI